MAALPQDNTPRYFLDYTADTVAHTLVMRVQNTVTDEAAIAVLTALLTAAEPLMSGIHVNGLRFAEAGSNVTNDVLWTGDTEYGPGFSNRTNAPRFVSFTGRDPHGHRTRVDLYGVLPAPGADYRIQLADDTAVSAMWDVIAATTDGCFMSINGEQAAWHQYANVGTSRYWVEQLRQGS